jgi:hypothetical protein
VHWLVAVTMYPDAHAGRDYSWTIGAFERDLGRFLREDEHVEPDSTGGYLPEGIARRRVQAIEKRSSCT